MGPVTRGLLVPRVPEAIQRSVAQSIRIEDVEQVRLADDRPVTAELDDHVPDDLGHRLGLRRVDLVGRVVRVRAQLGREHEEVGVLAGRQRQGLVMEAIDRDRHGSRRVGQEAGREPARDDVAEHVHLQHQGLPDQQQHVAVRHPGAGRELGLHFRDLRIVQVPDDFARRVEHHQRARPIEIERAQERHAGLHPSGVTGPHGQHRQVRVERRSRERQRLRPPRRLPGAVAHQDADLVAAVGSHAEDRHVRVVSLVLGIGHRVPRMGAVGDHELDSRRLIGRHAEHGGERHGRIRVRPDHRCRDDDGRGGRRRGGRIVATGGQQTDDEGEGTPADRHGSAIGIRRLRGTDGARPHVRSQARRVHSDDSPISLRA